MDIVTTATKVWWTFLYTYTHSLHPSTVYFMTLLQPYSIQHTQARSFYRSYIIFPTSMSPISANLCQNLLKFIHQTTHWRENQNSVIIYSPPCPSKPLWPSFSHRKQIKMRGLAECPSCYFPYNVIILWLEGVKLQISMHHKHVPQTYHKSEHTPIHQLFWSHALAVREEKVLWMTSMVF